MHRRYSTAWFGDALDALEAFVLIKDERSRILWANRAFCDYYGVTRDELSERIDSDHSDPDDTLQYVRDDRQAFTSREALTIVEPITRHDGVIAHYLTTKTPFDHEDRPVGTVGLSVPASEAEERRSAEGRTRRKTVIEKVRQFFSRFPMPAALVDAQRRIVAHSKSFGEALALNSIVGSEFEAAIGSSKPLASLVARAIEGAQAGSESDVRVPTSDRLFDVEVRPWTFDEGAAAGALVVFSDVTELRASERRLAKANEELRTANAAIADARDALAAHSRELENLVGCLEAGVLVTDAEGNVALCNGAAEALVGPQGFGPSHALTVLQLADAKGVPVAASAHPITAALAGVRTRHRVFRLGAQGGERYVAVSSAPVEHSSRFAAAATVFDVTERVRFEQELEQFAFVAAHDLQEPLRMVTSYITLLEESLESKLDEEAKEYVHFVRDSAERMRVLVQGLLRFNRMNRQPVEAQPTRLKAVVREALMRLDDAGVPHVGSVALEGTFPTLRTDPTLAGAIFRELVKNALIFAHADREPRVRVLGQELDDSWSVVVEDEGIGFDPKYTERIFQIFQRLHTSDSYPGAGMGLALAKRLATRLGATIEVESTQGAGSAFHVRFRKALGAN
ncbi:MAG: PAS domain-containing protein [Myxococcota bacterium]